MSNLGRGKIERNNQNQRTGSSDSFGRARGIGPRQNSESSELNIVSNNIENRSRQSFNRTELRCLEMEDTFAKSRRWMRQLWIPHYLPHSSSRQAGAARCKVSEISSWDSRSMQNPSKWNHDVDGETRFSSLQTSLMAGPESEDDIGQHRFRRQNSSSAGPRRTAALLHATLRLLKIRTRALDDRAAIVALWMNDYEDKPDSINTDSASARSSYSTSDSDTARTASGIRLHPFGDTVDHGRVLSRVHVPDRFASNPCMLAPVGARPRCLLRRRSSGSEVHSTNRNRTAVVHDWRPRVQIQTQSTPSTNYAIRRSSRWKTSRGYGRFRISHAEKPPAGTSTRADVPGTRQSRAQVWMNEVNN